VNSPLIPPTHVIDAPGVFVPISDPSWDHERINREAAELRAKGVDLGRAAALAELGHDPQTDDEHAKVAEAAELAGNLTAWTHPVLRYIRGETRYQLDAPVPGPDGAPTSARAWLTGVDSYRFTLVRPGRKRIRAVEAIDNIDEMREAWIRAVVRRIDGPDGHPVLRCWAPAKDSDEVPEEVFEAMFAWSPALIRQVADACKSYCRGLMDSEGKR
jgi:hypothetical protein